MIQLMRVYSDMLLGWEVKIKETETGVESNQVNIIHRGHRFSQAKDTVEEEMEKSVSPDLNYDLYWVDKGN